MVTIFHQNGFSESHSCQNKEQKSLEKQPVAKALLSAAKQHPGELLIWCRTDLKNHLNTSAIEAIFHHKKIMASFNPGGKDFLPDSIGYVEDSPFIKVNKKIAYPTWRMGSPVGGIHASVLLALESELVLGNGFGYFLHSLGKTAMPLGLQCYSEPKLLTGKPAVFAAKQANVQVLFRFVKQHYKTRWVFLLMLNLMLYEKRFPVMAFLSTLFYRKRKLPSGALDGIAVQSSRPVVDQKTIDVVIPTMGRKEYLYDVMKDLAAQTHLPKKVIIVEQNPQPESVSELNYLTDESWPFQIKHQFIHQSGACNARNLALKEVVSEWVFLADDDIRVNPDFIERAFFQIEKHGQEVFTVNCLQKSESPVFQKAMQWPTFGSGCSIIKKTCVQGISFSGSFEHGYGEDTDFGMQLRNKGFDVIFLPKPEILHLKAPVGGFRVKPTLPWQQDAVRPKPSPTVMLFRLLYHSAEQLKGYKTMLFFKFYNHQKVKNPIRYFSHFQKSWHQSLVWANKLRAEK